ncbi:MAG: hypothetical protein SH847_13325, partial [Roseiflexaceae bacterium]|nr:hypothetical protein [Roseiflexaceae bacterium]
SPATDVYAVGALLYTFLTGVAPPEATAQTQPVLFQEGDSQAISADLSRITRKALRVDQAERYPHAQAMLDDLQRLPYVRASPSSAVIWGGVSIVVVVLIVLAITIATLVSERSEPPLAASGATPEFMVRVTQPLATATLGATPTSHPEPGASPAPTLASTIIVTDTAVLLAPPSRTLVPTISALPTSVAEPTPGSYLVRQIEVAGQADSAAINVRMLPVSFTLIGERLEKIQSVVLQPKSPGQRTINLHLLNSLPNRADFELASLPLSFRTGEYELMINGERNRTLVLRDYVREARLQGVKLEYRYLAAIRPFPSIRSKNQDIPGPFTMLYQQPDPAERGSYLRNGDLVEILDDKTNPNFYRVRVRENFDPSLVGKEGWVWAWVVDGTPPSPPTPGAIQMPYNIRGESLEQVTEWLTQRGVPADNIESDPQSRERIPEVFDHFKPKDVVSSQPAEGEWIAQSSKVILGIRAP